jgi:hypothetical protein
VEGIYHVAVSPTELRRYWTPRLRYCLFLYYTRSILLSFYQRTSFVSAYFSGVIKGILINLLRTEYHLNNI